jgi:dephospho-CoA kinase
VEAFLDQLAPAVSRFGPWLVFAITLLETACFIGLLLPAEATILLASFLAADSYFSIESVFVAAAAGGFAGDQIGYFLGRYGGDRAAVSDGRIGRMWRRHEVRAHSLFRRQPLLAISGARFVSFVRTLTPWLAGMSGMRYRRYATYDAIGVAAWAAASVALGYIAGQSWEAVARYLGIASAGLLVAFVVAAYVALKRRREARRARAEAAANGGIPLYRVGLTGNIASGKSAVADVWAKLGAEIIDADILARAAVAPGSPALATIRRRFGEEVIGPTGELDRERLRAIVFGDDVARKELEAIIHPQVELGRREAEAALRARGARIAVHVIPLLFEVNLQDTFDETVFVDAPEDARLERIVTHRGLSAEQARAMIDAQTDADEKLDYVDHVIDNDGTLEELEHKAAVLWRGISERACA